MRLTLQSSVLSLTLLNGAWPLLIMAASLSAIAAPDSFLEGNPNRIEIAQVKNCTGGQIEKMIQSGFSKEEIKQRTVMRDAPGHCRVSGKHLSGDSNGRIDQARSGNERGLVREGVFEGMGGNAKRVSWRQYQLRNHGARCGISSRWVGVDRIGSEVGRADHDGAAGWYKRAAGGAVLADQNEIGLRLTDQAAPIPAARV